MIQDDFQVGFGNEQQILWKINLPAVIIPSFNKRTARIFICRSDSSPEIYSTVPERAISTATWSMRVDLPIPGSPPTSTIDPGTTPPPSTRANSPIGRARRISASPSISAIRRGSERPPSPRGPILLSVL